MGEGLYLSREIPIGIPLAGDQWAMILLALASFKKNHLPYEDEFGHTFGIEFFDTLINGIRKHLT
jgi:hypothetical protein